MVQQETQTFELFETFERGRCSYCVYSVSSVSMYSLLFFFQWLCVQSNNDDIVLVPPASLVASCLAS